MAADTTRVIARFKIKPENVDAFIEGAMSKLVEPTRGEPGCISYVLCQDREDPTRFALVEEWESEEALRTHLSLPALQQSVAALMPLGDGTLEVQRLRSLG